MKRVAIDAPELDDGPVAGLGQDLVCGPVAVGELEIHRRPDAFPAAFLVVEPGVMEGVEDPPPRVLEALEERPLRLVVEEHDIEGVAETGADRFHRRFTGHPRTAQIDVVG